MGIGAMALLVGGIAAVVAGAGLLAVMTGTGIMTIGIGCLMIALAILMILGPVSYTHLDVYKRQLEALAIAQRIKEIVGKEHIVDKETKEYRPVEYGDIVILLRTAYGWAETFRAVSYTHLDVYKRQD